MKELIRHILQESNVKTELLDVIQDEDIFAAADLVGGINNLRRIFKDDPKMTNIIDSLKGKLNLVYHSLKEYIEFPVRFEIVGKGVNIPKTNSWPIVNLIYDDSNLSNDEKKFFEQFVYDTIGDLNIDIIDIKPEALKMFRERNGYIHIKYVNGRDWESLDHEIQPEDNDMRNIHRELYTKSDINESKILQENEEDPTKKILNFLRRRSEVEEKNLGGEEYPINFKILRIYIGDGTWDSITRFENKKEQVRRILNILMDNRIIDRFEFNETRYNPYAQQAIRAVKTFLNQVMGDKSNITESKDVSQNKKVKLVTQMIYDLFDEVTNIEQSTYLDKPLLTIYFKTNSKAANITSWFAEYVTDEIDQLIGDNVVVLPYWTFYWDPRLKNVDIYINTKQSDEDGNVMNESKILDKIKSFFGKKPLTKEEMRDERLINVVVRFINETYTMEGTRDEWGTVTIYLTDERGNTIYLPMMRYYPDSKRLEYNWDFARDIHDMIGDDRLLHLDSEMMGKIFEKLFDKKVVEVYGYSRL